MPPKKSTKETIPLSTSEGVSTRSQQKKGGKKQEPKKSIPIEDGKLETLFDNLRTDYLGDICRAAGLKLQKARKSTNQMLMDEFAKQGEEKLFEKVGKDLLKDIIQVFEKVEHDNKSKMEKSVKDLLKKDGQKQFYSKLSVAQLDSLSKLLGFEEDGSHEEKVHGLLQELIYNGAKVVFHELKKDQLVDIAIELGLEKSGSKDEVIKRVLSKVYPQILEETEKSKEDQEAEPAAAPEPVEVKPIDKAESKEDLYQHYTKDLQEFAAKNGLKKTGNKRDLVNNILKFLKGDVEGTKALKPGEAAKIKKAKREELKRKRAETAKAKATNKDKTTTDQEAPAAKKQKTA